MSATPLPKLILLPGLDGSGAFFAPVLAALDGKVRAEVLTYPVDGAQTYDALASRILPLLPEAGDYVLLGESFAGPLAILLATRARHKPKALILSASFVRNPFPMMGMVINATLPGFLASKPLPILEATLLRKGDHQMAWDIFQSLSKLKTDVLSARVKTAMATDVRKELAALPLPVLYLQGRHDKLVSSAQGELVRQTGRKVQIARTDTPHFVLQYDVDTTVDQHILPFLSGLS